MKRTILSLLSMLFFLSASGQDLTGRWTGMLNVEQMHLRIAIKFEKIAGRIVATVDSPDQNSFGMPASKVTFENDVLYIEMVDLGVTYKGNYANDEISGIFEQGGYKVPLAIKREKTADTVAVRPQEPKPPFPYISEDVKFENRKDGVSISGTLTLPNKNGKFPAVVMITSLGPHDRDNSSYGHKPFLVIADFLTKNGIAVLRYDDRGTAGSTGDFSKSTFTDFFADASCAVDYLRSMTEIDKKNIGICGYNEGGEIAGLLASKRKDVAFLVLMSSPGVSGHELFLSRQEFVAKQKVFAREKIEKARAFYNGAIDIILGSDDNDSNKAKLEDYFLKHAKDIPDSIPAGISAEDAADQITEKFSAPWMQDFLRYDPRPALKKVNCPVLALGGKNDIEVPSGQNLAEIKSALDGGGNRKVTVREYPSLNHLFQKSNTGSPDEYKSIEETISPQVLSDISDWIKFQLK